MPNLQGVLAGIPGLAGYAAGGEEDQLRQMQRVQVMGALQRIAQAQRAAQDEAMLRQAVMQAGGDPTKAMQSALASGNVKAASALAPIIESQRKAAQPQGQAIGAGGLRMPDGTIIPPAARPDAQGKAPTMRTRVEGETQVQEEYQPDGTWKEVGRGPRFARQVMPSVVNEAPVTTIVVKDPESSTGWSYKDARTGRVTSKEAPAPAADPGRNYGREVSKEAAQGDTAQYNAALSASQDLPKIKGLVKQIESSDALTGMGADILKNIHRARVLIANDKKAGKIVSDTEFLDTLMGSEVFPMIKALGIGARGLDTPAEREFLRKVMTGEISLNKETLLRMARMRQDITERAVKRWNDRVQAGELDQFFTASGKPKRPISVEPDMSMGAGNNPPPAPAGKWKVTPVK